MTDKSHTPRPGRVSKAPPPIVPISTKQNILPDLPPVPPPNWGKWAYMRDIELWEAAALSLNLEPDKLPVYFGAFDKFRDDPFRICPTPFLERLLVANSNCGISLGFKPVHELKARCLVDLPEFAAWAVKLNIPNLPPELLAMADTKAAQNLMPVPETALVVADGDAPAKRSNRKPSWATVAMPYMKSLFTAGHYKSASMFYKALMHRAGESDSPFKLVNRELYCTEAGTTVSDGALGNVWPQIRAH